MGTGDSRPTMVRYGVLAFLGALAFVLYIDRNCMSQAAPEIITELGLTETHKSILFGAFTLAYGLFEVITGHWGDRYGSRRVLIRIVLWWSAFTALTGCVWNFSYGFETADGTRYVLFNSFALMVVIRFLFGAGEAGALPNTARVIAQWFPPGRRGPAQSIINTSMLLGGATAPVGAAYLMKLVGWRWSFVAFGSLGLVWAWFFARWFRDSPAQHPAVNDAELKYIASDRAGANPHEHPRIPWRSVLACPSIWLLGATVACAAFYAYLIYTWLPSYLQNGRGVSKIASAWMTSSIQLVGAVGCIAGGYLVEWLTRCTGSRRWALRGMGAIGLGVAGLGAAASIHVDDPWVASSLLAVALFGVMIEVAAWWGAMTDISGPHLGALFGLCNSLGVIGSFTSQVFYGPFVDYRGALGYTGRAQWDPAFYLYAGVVLVGAVCWLGIDPTRSAVEPHHGKHLA